MPRVTRVVTAARMPGWTCRSPSPVPWRCAASSPGEGIGDADGAPVAVSPETIGRLLNDPSAFESIDRLYAQPVLERRGVEKRDRFIVLADWIFGKDGEAYCEELTARTGRKPAKAAAPAKAAPAEKGRPLTDDGVLTWDVIQGCRWQLRAGMAGPTGLGFGAVLAMAGARGIDPGLLADVLPDVEQVLVLAARGDGDDGVPDPAGDD